MLIVKGTCFPPLALCQIKLQREERKVDMKCKKGAHRVFTKITFLFTICIMRYRVTDLNRTFWQVNATGGGEALKIRSKIGTTPVWSVISFDKSGARCTLD